MAAACQSKCHADKSDKMTENPGEFFLHISSRLQIKVLILQGLSTDPADNKLNTNYI